MLERVSGSLAERLLNAPSGERIVPLELVRGYRDVAAEQREVELVRYVRCTACGRRGCERCNAVGWTLEHALVEVVVPHGAGVGARLIIEGVGDVVEGDARAIVVEIVSPGPRAEELRAAQADLEGKLATARTMELAIHGGKRRRVIMAGGLVVVLLALLPIGQWLGRAAVGETCTSDESCRSAHCVRLVTLRSTHGDPERLDGRVCTASCTTDLDCPSSMDCRPRRRATDEEHTQVALDVPEGLACIPHGY